MDAQRLFCAGGCAVRAVEGFAGAGGAALGLRLAGLEHLACVERDPAAAATLAAAGFPAIHADVRDVDWSQWKGVDLAWFSPPCQAFSLAGKREGPQDDRNGWPWTLDAIDALQPRWVICENVPGLLKHDGAGCGSTARCAGCYWVSFVLPQFHSRFPWCAAVELNAVSYGVPQERRRVFLVAGPHAIRWPAPTHGPPGQLGLFSSLEPWVSMEQALGITGTLDGGRNSEAHPAQERVRSTTEPAPTIGGRGNQMYRPAPTVTAGEWRVTANQNGHEFERRAGNRLRRRLTTAECAVLQSFPADWPWTGCGIEQYRQIGNAVPPPLARALGAAVIEADQSTQKPCERAPGAHPRDHQATPTDLRTPITR